ncbi:MAG: aminotransferase, partial [Chloroflexota bacterium]
MKENFYPFLLEREMSIWENQVKYNLSESGVHPMTMRELFYDNEELIEETLSTELNYPQTNGTIELRENIARLYPGASPEQVVVTTGAAQANFTTLLTL